MKANKHLLLIWHAVLCDGLAFPVICWLGLSSHSPSSVIFLFVDCGYLDTIWGIDYGAQSCWCAAVIEILSFTWALFFLAYETFYFFNIHIGKITGGGIGLVIVEV